MRCFFGSIKRENSLKQDGHYQQRTLRITAAHFIKLLTNPPEGDMSALIYPFCLTISSLTVEEKSNVDLVVFLLGAAEKVSEQQ